MCRWLRPEEVGSARSSDCGPAMPGALCTDALALSLTPLPSSLSQACSVVQAALGRWRFPRREAADKRCARFLGLRCTVAARLRAIRADQEPGTERDQSWRAP